MEVMSDVWGDLGWILDVEYIYWFLVLYLVVFKFFWLYFNYLLFDEGLGEDGFFFFVV